MGKVRDQSQFLESNPIVLMTYKRAAFLIPFLIAIPPFFPSRFAGSLAPEVPPDIVMIVVDDVGEYDVANIPTPVFDQLASESIRFPNANVTSSMCSPSRTAVTGRYGRRFGIGRIILKNDPVDIPSGTDTIATHLAAAGYTTAHIGKWHLNSSLNLVLKNAPGLMGFDNWRATATHNLAATTPGGNYENWGRVDDGVFSITTQYATEAQTDAAINWWEETTGPRFMWVAYTASHKPFHTPPSSLLPAGYTVPNPATSRDLFEAATVVLDAQIGRLISVVQDDAIVIFWSDNGTPDDAVGPGQDPAKVKQSMYEGGVGTPFWVRLPNVEITGETRRVVSSVDLFATALDLAGVVVPVSFDSFSFADVLGYESSTDARTWNFAERFVPNGFGPYNFRERMIRDSRYKLIVEEVAGVETFRGLFDLAVDPDEETPIFLPEKEAAMQAVMDGI